MAEESTEVEGKKKGRKRVKAILGKIKDQMEFYFSDSNLHKDRFLKKTIDETKDGYIDLSIFLRFNRIQALTEEVKMIADAVAYKSDLLQLNDDRTKVKRIKPLSEQKNVDERTVYVEYLPAGVDHEWVKKVFSACGKVAYVSLPKFRTSGDRKGFGFVEFDTVAAASLACEELNNPPVEAGSRIGMFPKSNKELESLKKKLPEDQILESEEKAKIEVQTESSDITGIKDNTDQRTDESLDGSTIPASKDTTPTSGGILKKIKRRRTKSDGSIDESFSGNDSSPQKRKKHEVSFDLPEEGDKSAGSGKKRSRKRKNRSKTVDVVDVAQGSDKTDKACLEKSDSEKSNDCEVEEKRRKVDKVADSETTDAEIGKVLENKNMNSDQNKSETKVKSDSVSGKKRKLDSKADDSTTHAESRQDKKRRRDSSLSQSESETECKTKNVQERKERIEGGSVINGETGKKKKKHRRRRKQHKQKDVPELRVIPKAEWLHLRQEYLRLQKASMTVLKRTLAEMKDNTNTEAAKEEEPEKKRSEIEFIPDVIVKVIADKPLVRKKLKNDLGTSVSIAYIDLIDGQTVAHIRCEDSDSAKQILSQNHDGYCFSMLSGEDEKLYWEKLKSDRYNKLSKKSRSKKRGHEKWMEKAQKASVENVERKHIIFEDE